MCAPGRPWKIFKTTFVVAALLSFAADALANGRFPRAQRLVESANDPNLLALYGTYGLIVSSDAGRSWNHVCEAATGAYTGEDPLLEILPDGKIVARTEASLVRSGGTWCDWTTIRKSSPSAVQDITRSSASPRSVLALVDSYAPGQGFSSAFVQSTDGGTTWSQEIPLELVSRGLSLDVAPSSESRIVVTGLDAAGAGKLLVSDDAGATWRGKEIPATDSIAAPYLAAIASTDADRIFVRTDGYRDINGTDTASDALLLSVDGGATWTTLIQRKAKLFGFTLSPDESTLLVGYGDPVVAATYVAPGDLGIYRADVAALLSDLPRAETHFEKIFDASVTCLRWTPTGLFACTSQKERGFELGRATDASFTLSDSDPFTPLLELPKVRPLPCAAGTDGYACYSDPDNGFASVCRVFETSCDASAPPAGGGRDSGAPVESGEGDGGTAGNGGAGGRDASVPAGGRAGSPGSGGDGSSCACRSTRPRNSEGAASVLLLAVGSLVVRRRRG